MRRRVRRLADIVIGADDPRHGEALDLGAAERARDEPEHGCEQAGHDSDRHGRVACVQPGSPAARRLEGMRSFYAYLFAELPALIARWRGQRGA